MRVWILIIVLVAVGGWLFAGRGSAPPPEAPVLVGTTTQSAVVPESASKPAVKQTTGTTKTATAQKQYYNEKFGFGFSYPANLTISQEVAQTYATGGAPALELGVYLINSTSHVLYGYIAVNQLVKDTAGPAKQNITTAKTTVAGVSSNQRLIVNAQSGFTKIDELFVAKGNTYELQFEYTNAQAQAVANTIIKSFYVR